MVDDTKPSRPTVIGIPVERLTDIAARHAVDLEAAEALALAAIAKDPSIAAVEYRVFLLWRSLGSMKAALSNDSALFQQALRDAARLDRKGII